MPETTEITAAAMARPRVALVSEIPVLLVGETTDADLGYAHDRAATTQSRLAAARFLPEMDQVPAARANPANPSYQPR
jgi:hypothetical protein